ASTYAPQGNALLIYPEGETLVYAVTENGKLSLARTLENANGEQLQLELPQFRLSAELQGISAFFPNVLLDEKCYELRDAVQGILASSAEIVGIELPPAPVKLNLLPESWRRRRLQMARQAEWRKRLLWAGGAYTALLILLLLYLGVMRFQIGWLDRRIKRDAPGTEFVRATEAKWKALAPAIDAHYYPVELLEDLRESLLSFVVAGIVLVLLNLWILSWIFGALGGARKELAKRKATIAEQALYMKERDLWMKRDEWIRQRQPTLKNPAEASALLDQLREVADKYNILIENPKIGPGETTPYH